MSWIDFFRKKSASNARAVDGGQWTLIHEPSTGAWQRNEEIVVSRNEQMRHHAIFACISLISRDVGKLKLQTKKSINGVRQVCKSKANALISQPNQHQTSQQFFENWVCSKATTGNTYVWKVRNIYGDIWRLYILNPNRVQTLVDPVGNVFYQVRRDRLFNLNDDIIIPASEIIHDRYNCFYHPLVGLSPIVACALSASQGINIQRNSSSFFANASRPSGVLVSPTSISIEKARAIRQEWNNNYSGTGTGKTAVLGDGMEYKPMAVTAENSQLVEQLKMSNETICTSFSVPPFKIGLGAIPAGQKVGDLNEIYYSDCLQHYIESIENLLNAHLELENGVDTEFNLKALLRMDSFSQMSYLKDGVAGAILSPNEARAELGYAPVDGGDSPMIQQQNYSLAALAKRDENQDYKQGADDDMGNA